jgi:TolA-binding protein
LPSAIYRLKIALFGIVGLTAFFLTIWIVWAGSERAPRRHFDAAEQKLRANDYLGAVREYERVTEEYPRSKWAPEAYFWSGVIYTLYLNQPQKGLDLFQKTLEKLPPQHPQALSARRYLAEVYAKLEQPREAIAEYEKVMKLSSDPDDVLESHYKVGELYFALGDLEQARTEWDLLVKKDPKSRWAPEALYRAGGIYFVAGKCKEAVEVYQKVRIDYPESAMAPLSQFRIANCMEEVGRFKEALEFYKGLRGRYPNPDLLEDKIKLLETESKKEPEGEKQS